MQEYRLTKWNVCIDLSHISIKRKEIVPHVLAELYDVCQKGITSGISLSGFNKKFHGIQ